MGNFGDVNIIEIIEIFQQFSILFLMESSDGFRRRTAFASQRDDISIKESFYNADRVMENNNKSLQKFNKMSQNILCSHKKDQQFLRVVQQIQQRKCTFYRMGFKSYEKKDNRKVLGQVLGLDSNKMKGTMFIGQLWSNRQNSKFLKENKIYMTKMKLMDKLQVIKKENQQAEKLDSDIQIDAVDSSKSLADLHSPLFNTTKLITKRASLRKGVIAESLDEIKSDLKQLKKKSGIHSLINEIKYLQRCQQKLDKVERRYFLKMLQLQ